MHLRLMQRWLKPKSRLSCVASATRVRRRPYDTHLRAPEGLEERWLLATILVPQDQPSIQAGIDAAQNGDLVLVAPGTYSEQLTLQNKSITLASEYHTTGDQSFIDQTIIDGSNNTVITVLPSVGVGTQVIGFTIQNGADGINADAMVDILHNRFTGHSDAIDYESGGGIIRNNVFENNSDDAIDLDGSTAAVIENNIIRDNGDDGIEIRLHAYTGPPLNVVIRNNQIIGSSRDGIQIIDQSGASDRFFVIERNLIQGNGAAGLGLLDQGDTLQDFRAASITDPIHLLNNTFIDNPYAVSGGDNMIALNNLFVNSNTLGLKNVDGNSIVSNNLFWNNGVDHTGSNVDLVTSVFADPLLASDYRLKIGSPAIDVGTAFFQWNGAVVLDLPTSAYAGAGPDLGRLESGNDPPILYFAYNVAVTLPGGLNVDNDDIVAFDGTTFSMIVDGSDLEFDAAQLDAIKVIDDDEILMSFTSGVFLPGISGEVDDSDIVKFTATQLGDTTAGTFELFFDGSDVGLETSFEDIDAVELLADGRVLISTTGDFEVPQVSGAEEDVIALTPTSLGDITAGSWSMYLDGSDVGLSGAGVDGMGVDATGAIYLTSRTDFDVPALAGKDEDILVFNPTSLGDNTAGTYNPTLLFDGNLQGAGGDLKAIDIPSTDTALTVEDVTAVEGSDLLFTVTLDNAVQGAFDVTVTFTDISASGGPTPLVSPADYANDAVTLSFAGAAGERQQFTLATLDDAVVEGSETFIVNLSATNALVEADDTATGTITDNDGEGSDTPGVTISGTTDVAEGSLTDSYIVVLNSVPTADVDISVTPDGQVDLGAGAGTAIVLSFTPGTAQTPQIVNVTAVDDAVVEGPHTSTITHAATSTDINYNGLSINDVLVSIADNDMAAVAIFETRVSAGSDDAEQRVNSGSMRLTSGDLNLVFDSQTDQIVGIRFTGVSVPQGATIQNAYIQFQADETSSVATSLTIRGEDSDDAQTFSSTDSDISPRPTTASAVSWSPAAWNTVGETGPDQQTPNIASVLQDIVNRPGWSSGNALAIILSGTGERVAESFDGKADAAPLLHVEFANLLGDANFDGRVDASDLNIVGMNWLGFANGWGDGDFNADGVVNSADLNALGINWLVGVPGGVAAQPVPRAAIAAVAVDAACARIQVEAEETAIDEFFTGLDESFDLLDRGVRIPSRPRRL